MKIVVLGAGGLLGRHCVTVLGATGYTRQQCDVLQADQLERLKLRSADFVVNCAAFTNVDAAEVDGDDSDEAWYVNRRGVMEIRDASYPAKQVYISTDSVFDGEKSEYRSTDAPRPLSVYGKTKLEGEKIALHVGGYVARVQGLYGDGGTNFASRIIGMIERGEHFRVDGERKTQPTWAEDAAVGIRDIIFNRDPGTYHIATSGVATWEEFAIEAARLLDRPKCWTTVSTKELGLKAPRPRHTVFVCETKMPPWQLSLRRYLESRRS